MGYTTNGLTNGGQTAHYSFQYDSALTTTKTNPTGPEPARLNKVIAVCEQDFQLMMGWFGNIFLDINCPIPVLITSDKKASGHTLTINSDLTVTLSSWWFDNDMKQPIYFDDSLIRFLLVAEMVEQFMWSQGGSWWGLLNEGSMGEGLSCFLSAQFLKQNGLGYPIANFLNSKNWLNSSRENYIEVVDKLDHKHNALSGFSTLFLFYLHRQLGYSINQIIAAGADNLNLVHKKLTGQKDGWTPFINIVNSHFSPGITVNAPADNIFPVSEILKFNPPNIITCGYDGTATLFLDSAAVADININLFSDNTSLATVLPMVTIPAGASSISVTISVPPLPLTFNKKFVDIHADYAGKTLTITVEIIPPYIEDILLTPSAVICGNDASGVVVLNLPSKMGDMVIDLHSSLSEYATLPKSIIIKEGQLKSEPFTITIPDRYIAFEDIKVHISGTFHHTMCSSWLTVQSHEKAGLLHSLSIFPATITSGNVSMGTVTLSKAVTTNTIVHLGVIEGGGGLPKPDSDGLNIAVVQSSVTIFAGSTSATFKIKTKKFSNPPLHKTVSIIAGALVTKYAKLVINSSK